MKTILRLMLPLCLAGLLRAAAPMLLVAGQDSDNLLIFDTATGRFGELARFPKNSKPRTVAVSPKGEIFVGLSGGAKNIVRVVPGNPAEIKPVTPTVGKYGPGVMAFGAGQIWVAGDTEHTIYQVNPDTGELTAPVQDKNDDNVVGLAVADNRLFVAEYAQRSIMTYEIGAGRLTGAHHLVTKTTQLNKPRDMIIGPNGDLFVANIGAPTVVQFDKKTGVAVKTLANLGFPGQAGVHGLAYAPETRRFYLASGPNVFETDSNGVVLATYTTPALRVANGMAMLAAAPKGFTPKLTATLKVAQGWLSVIGVPGEHYRVMASTDLKKWQPVPTPDDPQQQLRFSDPTAITDKKRVYRLELATAGK